MPRQEVEALVRPQKGLCPVRHVFMTERPWQSVVELPWAALRASPGLQRDASTQATRDIGEEMQQSWERAPPQPEGRAGFTPIALLRVVADDRRRLPPCASLSDQILPARPRASSTTDCYADRMNDRAVLLPPGSLILGSLINDTDRNAVPERLVVRFVGFVSQDRHAPNGDSLRSTTCSFIARTTAPGNDVPLRLLFANATPVFHQVWKITKV